MLGWVRALESRTVGGEGYESSDVRAFFSLDGVEPGWHVETMRLGDCRLLEYRPGFCDACNGICVAPDVCRPYPTGVDVGPVGLTTPFGEIGQSFGIVPAPMRAARAVSVRRIAASTDASCSSVAGRPNTSRTNPGRSPR